MDKADEKKAAEFAQIESSIRMADGMYHAYRKETNERFLVFYKLDEGIALACAVSDEDLRTMLEKLEQ